MVLDLTLTKRLGDFAVDVAFRSQAAAVTALFGPSGSGKSSVIAMVAGLSRPDRGRVVVGGRVLFDSDARVDVPPHQRRIGYVFQDSRLFPHLTVRGNLTYGQRLTPVAERYVDFDQVVAVLGIEALLDRRPAKLSGGEKQRVAIGRALLSSPRLLLMDEPLAALDGARKAELLPFIAQLPRQFAIPTLYVSHAVDEVLRLADTVVLMDHGKAQGVGPVEEMIGDGGSVLAATVAHHNGEWGITHLTFAGGVLRVPQVDHPPGTPVRVRVDAAEIILARDRPSGLSVQNIFEGRILQIVEHGFLVDVVLDVGCHLRAQITAHARAELGLIVGIRVFALIKSASISRGDIAERPVA